MLCASMPDTRGTGRVAPWFKLFYPTLGMKSSKSMAFRIASRWIAATKPDGVQVFLSITAEDSFLYRMFVQSDGDIRKLEKACKESSAYADLVHGVHAVKKFGEDAGPDREGDLDEIRSNNHYKKIEDISVEDALKKLSDPPQEWLTREDW